MNHAPASCQKNMKETYQIYLSKEDKKKNNNNNNKKKGQKIKESLSVWQEWDGCQKATKKKRKAESQLEKQLEREECARVFSRTHSAVFRLERASEREREKESARPNSLRVEF